MTAIPFHIWLALAIATVWLIAVLVLRIALPPSRRDGPMRVMVLLGVPTLGWLTLKCGPGIGGAGFLLGLLVLLWPARRSRPLGGVAAE